MKKQLMDPHSWYPALLKCGVLVTALYKLKKENENNQEMCNLIKLLLNSFYGEWRA